MHIIATAGHVDHGKSSLVRALTGIDPDRWDEEKRRGLTIDLGFADLLLPSGLRVAFIDVPGHIRFLKNMLAGVGGVDACLFVVSAVEGWKPQSEEHLRILDLLGLRHGLVALTNADVADEELLELAQLDVEDRLAGSFLEGVPVIPVGAPIGLGLDDLRNALDRLTDDTPTAVDYGRPRLWVDRSFAIKGSGTIVTGTLTGGSLAVGDAIHVRPGPEEARIRSIQNHSQDQAEIGPGNRVALNLSGIEHRDVTRGDVLVHRQQWHHTRQIDATLRVLDHLDHDVSRRGAYLAYIGAGEFPVALRVLGPNSVSPGELGLIRLHLPVALPLVPGDRYILRESGRSETVGGGEILDVNPQLPASRAVPDRSIGRVVRERGWIEAEELARLTGQLAQPNLGRWVVDPDVLAAATDDVEKRIEAAGGLGLDIALLDERERAIIDTLTMASVHNGRVKAVEARDPLADHPFVAALEADLFRPPDASGVDRSELSELIRRGLVVNIEGIYFAPNAVDGAARAAAELLAASPGGFTPSELRIRLDTTRKYLLPLLHRLDTTGVTRHRDPLRIAGPRLPQIKGDP